MPVPVPVSVPVSWFVALSSPAHADAIARLRATLAGAGWGDGGDLGGAADLAHGDAVVVVSDQPLPPTLAARLAESKRPVLLIGRTLLDGDPDGELARTAGLVVAGASPIHDVRLRPGADGAGLAGAPHAHGDHAHRDLHEHVRGRVGITRVASTDVQVLRTARLGLVEHPVVTWRPTTATAALALDLAAEELPGRTVARLLVGLLALATGVPTPQPVRVGLLGYGAIGAEHSRAVGAVDGLELAAVCDTSEERLAVARTGAPDLATTTSAEDLLGRDDLDLVVVSTPPSSHAGWALRALAAGRHVVIEKPFALRTAEADEVIASARSADRLAVVYQNRRFDPDHLAVRRSIQRGDIGEVFHVEVFVGGYGHPCNLWHSDEGVSGGAFYDWGAHLLDQVLDLIPAEIEHVTASAHKRRWFDVTNADHSRVSVRFAGGAEAHFIHSDLAAALKPRWYVLGTEGAIVGHWRTERIVGRSDIGTLVEDVLAPADSPPLLERHTPDGSVTRMAAPAPEPYGFHRELADHLRWGLPMSVTAAQSRRVLAVMEAASASAAEAGRPVVPR